MYPIIIKLNYFVNCPIFPTSKSRSLPHASGDQLERSRADFLPRCGNAYYDTLAPPLNNNYILPKSSKYTISIKIKPSLNELILL